MKINCVKGKIEEYRARSIYNVSASRRFKALMVKNGVQFFRYYSGIIFAVLFPLVEVASFFIGVTDNLKDLSIGIVNHEAGNCDNNIGNNSVWYDQENLICRFSNLSCRFLHEYGDSIAEQKYYDSIAAATEATHNGDLVGVMHFNHNFSEALQNRVQTFSFAEPSDILHSTIDVFLDMGDMQTGLYVEKKLYERFLEIFKDVMKDCGYSSRVGALPIRFEDAIYSDMNDGYNYFVAPSFIMILLFFLATTISTTLIITDRAEGVWDRSLVQGVKNREILVSHIITQTTLIIIHVTMVMILFFPIWGLECEGSYFHVFLIMFLNGLAGLMYGFFISVACKNHTMANYASAGSFFPLIIMSASIWPVQGISKEIRWLSYSMPTTLPSIALRAIIFKGYSLDEEEVFTGMLVSVGYILILFIVVLFGLRSKS